jgi:hypothetical protein
MKTNHAKKPRVPGVTDKVVGICIPCRDMGIPPLGPKEAKKLRFPPRKEFDLISIVGFNAGSLLRIPRAPLLSGIERLGSLKERNGYRESWATVERS